MLSLIPQPDLPPQREPEPEARHPNVSFGRLGIVLFLGSETMFFFALIGSWMTLVTSKPQAIQVASIALLPQTLPIGLSLLPLALGSVACYAFKKTPMRAALICGVLGIAFIAWRILILIHINAAGHSIRQAVALAIFYLVTGIHLLHICVATLGAWLRVLGVKSPKLDALSPFWVHGTLLGAIVYVAFFLTMEV